MIGTSPTESLLSLLFSPLLSCLLFFIYKLVKEIIKAVFDLFKNIRNSYKNLFKRGYFVNLKAPKCNRAFAIISNIFSGVFFAFSGVVLSVYYYVMADGKLSFLGPVLVLSFAIILDKSIGNYEIFYKGALLFTRLLLFIPLAIIKLYCLLIDKMCKLYRK